MMSLSLKTTSHNLLHSSSIIGMPTEFHNLDHPYSFASTKICELCRTLPQPMRPGGPVGMALPPIRLRQLGRRLQWAGRTC